MALFSVLDVVEQCQYHLSDFPPMDDPNNQALNIVNYVQSDIVRSVRLYPLVQFSITLVAGQQYYTLDPSIYHIWSCIWQNNSNITSQIKVFETSLDELDYQAPNWQSQTPANIYKYFEVGGQIGFVPPPSVPTSSGYPIVLLNTTVAHSLGGGSFTASLVSTTTITVTAVGNGSIALGQAVSGSGIPTGTIIQSFGTGTGGLGTYVISNAATLTGSSEIFTGDFLAPQIPTMDAWVWASCARWATMQRRDDAAGFGDLAQGSKDDLINFVNARLARQKPRVMQSYPRVRNI